MSVQTRIHVGRGHHLEPTTARQFMLWNWAFFQRFGVDMVVNWTDRTEAEQVALLGKYYTRMAAKPRNSRGGYYWDGSWWERKGSVIVAKPNTSRHQLGFCADVESFRWSYNATMAQWARDTAALYGFVFNVVGEDWHVDRTGPGRITSGNMRMLGGAPIGSTPATPNPAPAPAGPTQEELDEMAATKGAAIVRDYETESKGIVRTALIYPDGTARKLTDKDDITGAVEAHAKIYGIAKDKDNPDKPDTRVDYTQLTGKQWAAWWKVYPGTKINFDETTGL